MNPQAHHNVKLQALVDSLFEIIREDDQTVRYELGLNTLDALQAYATELLWGPDRLCREVRDVCNNMAPPIKVDLVGVPNKSP